MSRTAAADNTVVYDDSYTVVQLREIAKTQGISGYSNMNKAQLVEALNKK